MGAKIEIAFFKTALQEERKERKMSFVKRCSTQERYLSKGILDFTVAFIFFYLGIVTNQIWMHSKLFNLS